MDRSLDLYISLKKSEFSVTVYEPENSMSKTFWFFYSPEEHPGFNKEIGEEIYSWITAWMEMMEEEED